jgi:hypothetical protein
MSDHLKSMPPPVYDPPRSCSFCGAAPDEAQKIVAGPAAGICDGCISLAIDVCYKAGVKVEGSALAERERILALLRNDDPVWLNKLREEVNDLLLPEKNEQIYRGVLGLLNIQVQAVLSAIAAKLEDKT